MRVEIIQNCVPCCKTRVNKHESESSPQLWTWCSTTAHVSWPEFHSKGELVCRSLQVANSITCFASLWSYTQVPASMKLHVFSRPLQDLSQGTTRRCLLKKHHCNHQTSHTELPSRHQRKLSTISIVWATQTCPSNVHSSLWTSQVPASLGSPWVFLEYSCFLVQERPENRQTNNHKSITNIKHIQN